MYGEANALKKWRAEDGARARVGLEFEFTTDEGFEISLRFGGIAEYRWRAYARIGEVGGGERSKLKNYLRFEST